MITSFCHKCAKSYAVAVAVCPACGQPRQRYRVVVRTPAGRMSKVCRNLVEARDVERELVNERPRSVLTLNDVYDAYVAAKCSEGLRSLEKVQYSYKRSIAPFLGARRLTAITPAVIEEYKVWLAGRVTQYGEAYAPKSVRNFLHFISGLFNYATAALGVRVDNPIQSVAVPGRITPRIAYLNEDQRNRLLFVLDSYRSPAVARLIRFALFTGLRQGEIFNLEWSDVDVARSIIRIRAPKSGKTEENIPIAEAALDVLLEQRGSVNGRLCFPSPVTGKRYVSIDLAWNAIKKLADIPADFRFHDLRHSFATDLINRGVPLAVIGRLLRHSSPAMTQVYAHISDESMRQAVALIKK